MASPGKSRKNAAAVRLAALRSRKLSRARRVAIARQAARARWARGSSRTTTGSIRDIWEIAEELTRDVPPEAWHSLPVDLTDQLDHYVYGTAKR